MMKTIDLKMIVAYLLVIVLNLSGNTFAQKHRTSVTVLNFDTQGVDMTPKQMGNLVRIELDKLDTFEVMDRYDVAYLIDKHNLDITNCYGKIGLVEVGNVLKSEKMFSGCVELYAETVIITIRLVDVQSATTEKTQIKEFLNQPGELQSMLQIIIREMFGLPNDENKVIRLTKKINHENAVNNPYKNRLNLSGPRMGITLYSGNIRNYLQAAEEVGGFDAYPAMFQFGYQFEIQYLNQGDFQALFEIIPIITGLDQSMVIPSLTFMNGLRNNKNGWEFAFGPIATVTTQARGFYDDEKNWHLKNTWNGEGFEPIFKTRLDSRGAPRFNTGFVFAFGKSIKSGKLNIPVNAYIIPGREGVRFGISFGYNAKRVNDIYM